MEKQYAYIKNNEVVNLVIFDDPSQELLNQFINENDVDNIVIADSNAYIGGSYDGINFMPQKPFNSWIYNSEQNKWEAPFPYPIQFVELEDGSTFQLGFKWDEENQEWYTPGLVE